MRESRLFRFVWCVWVGMCEEEVACDAMSAAFGRLHLTPPTHPLYIHRAGFLHAPRRAHEEKGHPHEQEPKPGLIM